MRPRGSDRLTLRLLSLTWIALLASGCAGAVVGDRTAVNPAPPCVAAETETTAQPGDDSQPVQVTLGQLRTYRLALAYADCDIAALTASLAAERAARENAESAIEDSGWWDRWWMPIVGTSTAIGLAAGLIIGFGAAR